MRGSAQSRPRCPRRLTGLLAAVLLLAAALPARPGSAGPGPPITARVQDPAERLAVWIERRSRGRRPLEGDDEAELRALLGDLRVWESAEPARRLVAADVLLELAVVDLSWPRPEEGLDAVLGVRRPGPIGAIGREALDERMAGPGGRLLAGHLAREVLGSDRPRDVRLLALQLLRGRYERGTEGALLAATRSDDDELRRAALAALAGWPRPEVHLFFLEELRRGTVPVRIAALHFERAASSLGPAALDGLRSELGRMYLSDDWRQAARARRLLPALDAGRAVPLLIEALSVWERRTEEGEGSRRIGHEVVVELQRISGRSIGAYPERWNRWWSAVREGRIDLPEEADEGTLYSRASFFGLQPVSDRVVFVVDRSASMGWRFGTGERTRHAEAVDQLFRYLEQAGEETRFGIVVFSDRGETWRNGLREAQPNNLRQARSWLARNPPQGGTHLRAGIDEALEVDRDGFPDLDRLEVDTVVVLCDGATAEGPGWVEGWLARVNEAAQIRFFCVQIGSSGDGTLEALAEESGGEFVRVSG